MPDSIEADARGPESDGSDPSIAELLAFAETLADAAAAETLPRFRGRNAVDDKADGGKMDPVTEADRGAELVIRTAIERTYPSHGILGEEFPPREASGRYSWVIDPIDGTRAFVTGLPLWGTLISLEKDGEPLIGILDQPYIGERFIGGPDGAELSARGERSSIASSGCASLRRASLGTTTPELFETPADREAFARVAGSARLLRYGGDCYLYAMVAAGHLDLVVEVGLKPFDISALIPIIRAAGGVVTNWQGAPVHEGGHVIAAATAELHAEALRALAGDA